MCNRTNVKMTFDGAAVRSRCADLRDALAHRRNMLEDVIVVPAIAVSITSNCTRNCFGII